VLLVVLAQVPAWAQAPAPALPDEDARAAAVRMFREGRAHMVARRWAEACASFRASQELDPASGTALNLGDCLERQGKLLAAYRTFQAAETLARQRNRPAHEAEARRRADTLEPQLYRFDLGFADPADDVAGIIIRQGDVVLQPLPGGGYPLELGDNQLEIVIPGRPRFLATRSIAAGDRGARGVLEVPAPGREGRATLLPGVTPAPAPVVAPAPRAMPAPRPGPARGLTTRRKVAIGLFIVALGGAAVGGYYGVRAMRRWDQAEAGCTEDGCEPASRRLGEAADQDAGVATVVLVGAGVTAVGAGVLWWLGGRGKRPRPEVALAPWLVGGAGMSAAGRF